MKRWVQALLFFVVAVMGLELMGSVITHHNADLWLKPADHSELHVKGDVSYPIFGGIQVRTPDGRVMTYPKAAVMSMMFEPQLSDCT